MPDNQAVPKPTVFVLFGATGDLAHRLVLPAFFRLAQARLLPEDWRLVGNGRGHLSHEDFQERVRDSLEEFGRSLPRSRGRSSGRASASPVAGSRRPTQAAFPKSSTRQRNNLAGLPSGCTISPCRLQSS